MEELKHKDNTVEKLKEELEMRGKYYFKGFGACFSGLRIDLRTFIEFEATPGIEKHSRELLSTIVNLYQSIPFEQIINHPDYDLLLEIKEAISRLVPEVESVLNGKKSIKETENIIKIISEKGLEYRARLKALLDQIRLQPGHEKDGFRLTDIDGKIWRNGI